MKNPRILFLTIAAMLTYCTSAVAQIEAKVKQSISIRGTGWEKVISTGTPVTIFAYKHQEDI